MADLDDGAGGLGVGEVGRLAVVQPRRLGDILERVVPAPRRQLVVHVVRRRRDGPAASNTHQSPGGSARARPGHTYRQWRTRPAPPPPRRARPLPHRAWQRQSEGPGLAVARLLARAELGGARRAEGKAGEHEGSGAAAVAGAGSMVYHGKGGAAEIVCLDSFGWRGRGPLAPYPENRKLTRIMLEDDD